MGGTSRNPASSASSTATAPTRRRLLVHPSAPGQRVALRHANALAACPITTAANAAPDAASSAWPVGKWSPGRQPATTSATTNAVTSITASTPNTRRSSAAACSARLLDVREHAVDDHDHEDRHRQLCHVGDEGEHAGHPQQEREEVGHLCGEVPPRSGWLGRRQLVRSVARQSGTCVGGRQTHSGTRHSHFSTLPMRARWYQRIVAAPVSRS